MTRVIRSVVSIGASIVGAVIGFAIGGPIGATIGAALFSAGARALLGTPGGPRRAAAAATLQIGEQPRQAVFGRAAVSGSLVDAFNYGGKYGTDWEVLVIAVADHRCDALEGFFVDDRYIAFTGDGNVAGFNNQLQVFWRSGTWGQTVPTILTSNGPGWTANDRGRGVAYVVVAYKSDDEKAKNPVWPSGRPRFRWVVRGLRCYQARKDSTVGGSGTHRWNDPATWQWTENPIDIAHNWRRGIYAGDLVDQPGMLLIGRGLSAIEAPPANVFARANLCDELVSGSPRYRIGGVAASTEAFIDVEGDFAAACAGVISQPEGAVEVDPGEAKAAVAHFTDADLIVGSKVRWNEGILGQQDASWLNTVVARYVEPAQRWAQHSAPVLRDLADITADGAPREQQLALDFVTNGAQAQRVGEIFRRFGRLWGRATVTLPPRFAFIEEGDWVTWQSDRRFGGATLTFRVEAWGSDAAWHHTLTLRQISASVYSDTAPLDDGSIASDQDPPPVVGAPDPASWTAAIVTLDGGGVEVPALRIAGVVEDPAARFVVFEYVEQVAAPGPSTVWSFVGSSPPDVTRADIPIPAGGTFWAAVSYVVDGVLGDRLVLGPLGAGGADFVGRLPGSRVDGDFGGNFIADPIFGDDWVYSNAGYSPGGSGANLYDRHRAVFFGEGVIWFVGSGFPALERAAVQVGETYYFSGWFFRSSSATGHIAGRVQLYDATGANVGVVSIPGVTTIGMATDTWTRLQGQWTCPAGVSYVRPLVGNNTGGTSGTIFVGLPYFGRHQPGADVTASAQRTIEPQFPVIEIKQGEAGHTGNRTVTHAAKRGTATLTGGTWSLPAQSLGAGSATINPGTGTVTLSGIVQSGSYTIRYTHSDGLATDLAVNVTYIPTPPGGVVSAKTAFATSNTGVGNTTAWSQVIALTVTDAPAGRLFFNQFGLTGGSRIDVSAGTGTADHEARLLINGTVVASVPSQNTVSGGIISFSDFSGLFEDAHTVAAGTVTVAVELRRTSGTGTITSMSNRLDVTVIAS
jgi:hypothetical protein